MATIFIDQQPYEINPQNNLLEAALGVGLDLPYFCWHPAMGSVGSCRQCAVQHFQDENDTTGRMVMACMTPLKEGARFSIKHPTCTDFRKQNIEWMMINHPHDCPVCDEGGECHLQDMTVMTGHNSRRYRFNKRTFRNQDLGPKINHEMNRCITCYRCVRFYKDLAGGTDLSAFANSGRVYFGRNEDGPLESGFSGNLAEVCPTGVFTDKVFHEHHTRKWDLETAPSICQQCSVGCNISPGARYGQLRRIQNRYHHEVNGYFICDKGRFGHEFVNSADRLKGAKINGKIASLKEANEKITSLLAQAKTVIGIGSAKASLEANWMLRNWVLPENFYDGELSILGKIITEAVTCLGAKPELSASLKDIREADAIVIIGEDINENAPMMALSCRQALANFAQQKAGAEQNIASWNDSAVRDYARGNQLPLFSLHVGATGLDDVAQAKCIVQPRQLNEVVDALAQALSGDSGVPQFPAGILSWINLVSDALKHAKKPVFITGTSTNERRLMSKVVHLASLFKAKNAKISLVVPEVNSIGLGLLKPKTLADLQGPVDVAIVLENDLVGRFGNRAEELFKTVKNLIVIDALETKTSLGASVVVPCLSFAESTGSVISQEGRLQRYFSVFTNSLENVESPWRMMLPFFPHQADKWRTNDQVCSSIAEDLGWPQSIFAELFKASFSVLGHKIARQTSEYSGRTAINANVTMHEPKPPKDPDSPLIYSMEGARTKIPLPLISSSWEPKWNSVQASFRNSLNARNDPQYEASGVRIFEHIHGKDPANKGQL